MWEGNTLLPYNDGTGFMNVVELNCTHMGNGVVEMCSFGRKYVVIVYI